MGQITAMLVGLGCLFLGLLGLCGGVSAPIWGLTWQVFYGSFVIAAFGTSYSAFRLAWGERPQPWPSRIAAGACFIVGGMIVANELMVAGSAPPDGTRNGMAAFAGAVLLLGIAHGILSGDRPAQLLLLTAVCAAIVAYVLGPGFQFYSP